MNTSAPRRIPGIRPLGWMILMLALLPSAEGCGAGHAAVGGTAVPEAQATDSAAADSIAPGLAEAVFDSAWSRVYHTYYDTTFGGTDWLALRDSLRPVARSAGTSDSLRSLIEGMLARLGDSHFDVIAAEAADAIDPDSIRGGEGEPGDVGIELRVVDGALVVFRVRPGSPADRQGVRTGWALARVDGYSADRLVKPLESAGNDRRLMEARVAWAADARLAGTVGDSVVAGFEVDGTVRELRLVSEPMPGTPVRFGNLPTMFASLTWRELPIDGGCVGLIGFDVWMAPILPELEEAFLALRHCQGFVLDLRGNPGGVGGMVMGVSGYFMDEQQPLGRLITRQNELTFVSMPRRVTSAAEPMEPHDGPLALLVDGQSMSTTEIFAAGLQEAGRARVFGETSGGQALPALMTRLPNDDVLMYAFANLVTPNGVRIEGRGVIPDREAPLQQGELTEGRDAALEAAIEWIQSRGTR